MSRGPHAYPMMRVLDGDAGGAADLQTDVMRFMAILALCLLAIFALVQSLPPVTASAVVETTIEEPEPAAVVQTSPEPEPVIEEPLPARALVRPAPPEPKPRPEPVVLTRAPAPKVTPESEPRPAPVARETVPAAADETPGFTLRFESDLALSRLVATGQVGVFAISGGDAQRMSVAESRISFWAAPVPGKFHEMDQGTVPAAVRDAFERTGRGAAGTQWAVTLPARLTTKLDQIMREHKGGALVIAKDGSLRREPS